MVGEFDSPAFHQQANDYRSDTLYLKGKFHEVHLTSWGI